MLFLHGARFTSEDWVKINAFKPITDLGWVAMAIDLPGKRPSNPTRFVPQAH